MARRRATDPTPTHPDWLIAGRIPEGFLNDAARLAVGDGVDGPTVTHEFNLPVMGPVVAELDVSIIAVAFRMSASDGGDRLHASVRARGHVAFPEMLGGAPEDRPSIVVRGDMLVRPLVRVDHTGVTVGLDVGTAELQQMVIETEETADPDDAGQQAQAQMSEMVIGMLGDDAFEILRGEMEHVALDTGPEFAEIVLGLGVEPGDGDAEVTDGALVMALRRQEGHEGTPLEPFDTDPERVTAAIASEVLAPVVLQLVERRLDGLPVPFDLALAVGDQHLRGRVRNMRLLSSGVPDFRGAFSWEIHPELRGDTIDVRLRAAWVEFPEILPIPVNRWSRQLGSMVGAFPIGVKLPAVLAVPADPTGDETISVRVEALDLRAEQIDLMVAADFGEAN